MGYKNLLFFFNAIRLQQHIDTVEDMEDTVDVVEDTEL